MFSLVTGFNTEQYVDMICQDRKLYNKIFLLIFPSDGVARVFSSDPDRFADADTQALFERQLSSFSMPAKTQAFGDIKMEDLPDSSDLKKPGCYILFFILSKVLYLL